MKNQQRSCLSNKGSTFNWSSSSFDVNNNLKHFDKWEKQVNIALDYATYRQSWIAHWFRTYKRSFKLLKNLLLGVGSLIKMWLTVSRLQICLSQSIWKELFYQPIHSMHMKWSKKNFNLVFRVALRKEPLISTIFTKSILQLF